MSGVPGQSESLDGSRWSLLRAARWVLVEAPAKLYMAGERSGGRVPWSFFAAMALLAVAGAGIGAAAAAALGRNVEEWVSGGLLAGIFVMLAWSLYALLALGVMWVVGMPPERAGRGDTGRLGHASGPSCPACGSTCRTRRPRSSPTCSTGTSPPSVATLVYRKQLRPVLTESTSVMETLFELPAADRKESPDEG